MNVAFFIVFSSQLEILISKKDYYFMILINLIITFLLLNSVFKMNTDEALTGSSGFVYTVIGSFLLLSKNNNLRFLSLVLVLDCLFELIISDGNNFTLIGHFVGIVGGIVFTLYYKISNMIKLKIPPLN
jgi:membrane associated rhomboid family serine protease